MSQALLERCARLHFGVCLNDMLSSSHTMWPNTLPRLQLRRHTYSAAASHDSNAWHHVHQLRRGSCSRASAAVAASTSLSAVSCTLYCRAHCSKLASSVSGSLMVSFAAVPPPVLDAAAMANARG